MSQERFWQARLQTLVQNYEEELAGIREEVGLLRSSAEEAKRKLEEEIRREEQEEEQRDRRTKEKVSVVASFPFPFLQDEDRAVDSIIVTLPLAQSVRFPHHKNEPSLLFHVLLLLPLSIL